MNLKTIPKIELHLHLDGSVRYETTYELLNGNYSKEQIKQLMTVNNCNNLNEYLEKFDLPLSILQTKENLTRVSYELCQDLEKENVIYAEIRFAPLLHLKNGLTIEEVVNSVLDGLNKSNIKTNLILCLMRGNEKSLNQETINIAKKYLNKGVCALDLAGAEGLYPNELYTDLFKEANKLNIPFTIHAGEASNKESMMSAIKMGAKRLGHGINYDNDLVLIDEIKKRNIALEICLTSNIQTKTIDNILSHPLYELYKKGVLTTINTDNRTVSNTTLTKEYELLLNNFNLTIDDIIKMNEYAIKSSFLSLTEKEKLLKKYHELL